MTIKFKTLTIKNFLSVGQVAQQVNFDNNTLTLILGENLDLGGDGAKNGTGKTTMLQALSYALFGNAINSIKRDNMINRTNGKNMMVTVDFSVNDVEYRIERGRKPTFLRFYVNNQEQLNDSESNDSQGDSRETQDAIERVLSMSGDMFKHIIGLNSYSEPFLALRANDQRVIIEQLLGITLLSEKAEQIKELNKRAKDEIQREDYRIRGVEEANRRISEQIESLRKRQRLWTLKRDEDLGKLFSEYELLSKIDIEQELAAHRELGEWNRRVESANQYRSLVARQTSWASSKVRDIVDLERQIQDLSSVNITAELAAHGDLRRYHEHVRQLEELNARSARIERDLTREIGSSKKLAAEIATLTDHRCYACGQDFHDEQHTTVLEKKVAASGESERLISDYRLQQDEIKQLIQAAGAMARPETHYATESEAIKHSALIENLEQQISTRRSEHDPYQDQLDELTLIEPGKQPVTHYDTEAEALKHSNRVNSLLDQITQKHEEVDPYADQIVEMEQQGLQPVSFDTVNELTRQLQHQEFLLDLLTNKKSFVRRRIIEQNLSYLNNRLTHYLDLMGLPHQVVFQNDLSVEITELGRDLDFDNLSRGERTRVILGLSFAFRDVFESLYLPINTLFVDELLDNGLDSVGVENSISLLKDMCRRRNKSVWLVSHRDELSSRVSSVLRVVKEGGFTTYHASEENSES